MSIIYRKVARDLLRNKTRTVLVVLSTAVGVLALGMVVSLSDLMTSRMTSEWEAVRPAHITLSTDSVDDDTVATLTLTPGVAEIEPAIFTTLRWKRAGETEWHNGYLIGRQDYRRQQQDIVRLWSGAWPQNGELSVERQSESAFDLPVGSKIIVKTSFVEREMQIVSVVRDLSTFPPQFGGDASFFVTLDTLRDILGFEGYNQLKVRLPEFNKDEAQAVGNQLKQRLEKIGLTVSTPQIQDPKRHFIQDSLDPILLIMGVLGALSLILSAFLVINTVNSVLAQQVSQIGMMKAVGATTGRVVRVYLAMVLIYGFIAVIVAVPLAALAAQALAGTLLALLNIETLGWQFVPRAVIMQLAVGLLVPALAALWPVLVGARITVRQAIASYGLGTDFGTGPVDKLIARIRGLPRPLALSLRNTFRRKGRVTLTQITLVIAGVMFMGVMSASSTLSYTLDRLFAAYSFDVWMVFDDLQRFERVEAVAGTVPGVTSSEMLVIQSGTLEMGGNRRRQVDFWGLLPDSPTLRPAMTAGRWLQSSDQNSMVVNQKIAQDDGLKVGDRVNVSFSEGNDSTWEIVGLVVDINNQGRTAFVPRETLTRILRRPDQGSMVWIKTDRHDAAYQDMMDRRLRAAFEANAIQASYSITSTKNMQQNMNQFNIITSLLLAMSVLAGLVGSLGLMGTMSINVLERSREVGVMRAIGASSGAIVGIFIVEGVILGLLSTCFAIPLSYPSSRLFSDALGSLLFKVPLNFRYSVIGLLIWLSMIVILSALASLWPALRAARTSVREALAYE